MSLSRWPIAMWERYMHLHSLTIDLARLQLNPIWHARYCILLLQARWINLFVMPIYFDASGDAVVS